jgi:ankyrin repeat protein
MEVNGYAFCSGLDKLQLSYETCPNLPGLVRPVTYLVRRAIFRPKYEKQITRNLPLSKLIDMYHMRKATKRHDKIYALLGMSSEDLRAAGLTPDYQMAWHRVMHQLVEHVLCSGISVKTWDDKEIAVIESDGYIIGRVVSVETSSVTFDEQHLIIDFGRQPESQEYEKAWGNRWSFHASAEPIREGDIVCYLTRASNPTIIRANKDHFTIVMIVATPREAVPVTTRPCMEESLHEFLLVWNWEESHDSLDGQRRYEAKSCIDTQILEYPTTESDKAARLYHVAMILQTVGDFEQAEWSFQEAADMFMESSAENHQYRTAHLENSALTYKKMGLWKEAREVFLDVIQAKAQVQGMNHPSTMWTLAHLISVAVDRTCTGERTLNSLGVLQSCVQENRPIPEEQVILAVRILDKDTFQVLLSAKGDDVQATEQIAKVAAENWTNGEKLLSLLLGRRADEVYITETVVEAAAGNEEDGTEAMMMLLNKSGSNVHITERVVSAAASNSKTGKDIIGLLLNRTDDNFIVTEAALLSVANFFGGETLMLFLSKSTNINVQGGEYGTVLQAVSARGLKRTVQLLLDNGAETNTQGGYFGTALQAASAYGDEEIVELLLDKGAEANAQGGYYGNALQAASANGDEQIVKLLLVRGAQVNAQGGLFGNALLTASYMGKLKVAKLLIENGADVNMQGSNYSNALQAASFRGKEHIVELLLDSGANVNVQGGYYGNALQAASYDGNEHVVELLLDKGADINVKGGHFGNALCAASHHNCRNVVEVLLERGADVEAADNMGLTPLNAAATRRSLGVVQMLLKKGADMETTDNDGQTPLYQAAANGFLEIVQLLLDKGANIAASNKIGVTPFGIAAANGRLDVVQLLLSRGADIESASHEGWTPLNLAAANGRFEVVQLLLNKGAGFSDTNNIGATPLLSGATHGHLEVVELLLDKGADLTTADNMGFTPLNSAANNGHAKVVKLLLDKGADAEAVNKEGWTALNSAAANGHLEIVELLLAKGVSLAVANKAGFTPLHSAASNGQVEVVETLYKGGADISVINRQYGSLLNYFAYRGYTSYLNTAYSQDQASLHLRDADGRTPLHFAARGGHVGTFSYLITLGLDHSGQDAKGDRLLSYACSGGSVDIINVILGMESKVPFESERWTPLHWACRTGVVSVVELLLQKGFRSTTVATSEPDGRWSPLSIAKFHGHGDIFEKLSEPCRSLIGDDDDSVHSQGQRHDGYSCDGCFHVSSSVLVTLFTLIEIRKSMGHVFNAGRVVSLTTASCVRHCYNIHMQNMIGTVLNGWKSVSSIQQKNAYNYL